MSKGIIHYFTGTGNTAHAVKIISERLHAAGHEVRTWQVKKDILPPVEVFDYHIIAFPVLSWSAPVMMKKYIRKMHRSENTKTAILAINGAIIRNGKLVKGYTGQAIEKLENILKRKKYDVFLTSNASFPDNWTQASNPCNSQDTEIITPLGDIEVHEFIGKFMEGRKELYRCGFFNKVWTYMVGGLFGLIGRRVFGKFFIADENCSGCAICAKACPAQTIKMKQKKPFWNTSCEDCNRCINICPEKAIQVSVPLFILQMVINIGLTVSAIWAIVVYIPGLIQLSKAVLVTVEVILIIMATIFLLWVSFVPIDAFFGVLQKKPALRRFFSKSYTKKFRRYAAKGFKPLDN